MALGTSIGLTLFQFIKRGENVLEEQFSVADGIEERYGGSIIKNQTQVSLIQTIQQRRGGLDHIKFTTIMVVLLVRQEW